MLSRVAASVFWMSRYIERSENVARLIGVNSQLQMALPELASGHWDPRVQVGGAYSAFRDRYAEPTRANVIEFLTFDPQNSTSIVSCVTNARENARSVREILSSEMWEEINRFSLSLMAAQARPRAMVDAHAFTGVSPSGRWPTSCCSIGSFPARCTTV